MELSSKQNLMLALAGTVRLPSPPPATASVSIALSGSSTGGSGGLVLRVTHKISSRLYMERIVRIEDVRAIYAVWPEGRPRHPHQVNPSSPPTPKPGRILRRLPLT